MRCLPVLLAVLATAGALAGPAHAEQGTGLYAPFPSPSGGARAERFVGQLGVKATRAELTRGEHVGRSSRPSSAAASRRAGIDVRAPDGLLLGLLSAGALVVALTVAVAFDRRKECVADPAK
jgi:hypothetical protein